MTGGSSEQGLFQPVLKIDLTIGQAKQNTTKMDHRARLTRAKARQKGANNLDVVVSANRTLREQHQTLPLCAFNRAGLPQASYILKLAEHSIFNPVCQSVPESSAFVVGGSSWFFTPRFYQKVKMVFPMTCQRTLAYVGSTSYTVCYTFCNSVTGELLVKGTIVGVLVNKYTLRPTPFPADFVQRYADVSNKENSPKPFAQTMPENNKKKNNNNSTNQVHAYDLLVRASDEDFMYHTNHSCYVTFALDAAADASMAGNLHNFPGDIAEYEVAKIEMTYKGQSFAGDNLVVYTWEDEKDKLVLHSQINRGETVITLCKLQFRPPAVSSNL